MEDGTTELASVNLLQSSGFTNGSKSLEAVIRPVLLDASKKRSFIFVLDGRLGEHDFLLAKQVAQDLVRILPLTGDGASCQAAIVQPGIVTRTVIHRDEIITPAPEPAPAPAPAADPAPAPAPDAAAPADGAAAPAPAPAPVEPPKPIVTIVERKEEVHEADIIVERAFTSCRDNLVTTLCASSPSNKNVNWAAALQASIKLAAGSGSEAVLVIITLNNIHDREALLKEADAIKNATVHLVGVGASNAPPSSTWISIPTLDALSRTVKGFPEQLGESPSLAVVKRNTDGIDIVVDNCSGATAVQILYVIAQGRNDLQKTEEMQLFGDKEFEFTIAAPSNTQVRIRARVVYDASTFRMTEWIKTSTALERKDASIVKQMHLLHKAIDEKRRFVQDYDIQKALLESDSANDRYKQFAAIDKVRIVAMGPAGVGKSSNVITFDACTAGRLQQFRVTRESSDCVSRDVYIRCLEKLNPCIELVDFWGYTGRRYSADLLRAICDGHLPHLHRIDAPLTNTPYIITNPLISDMVHAVMLEISVNLMTNSNVIDEFRLLYADLQQMGYQCIVLVTKPDEADPTVAEPGKAHYAYTSGQVQELIESFSKAVMIGPEYIIPCLNMLGDFKSEEEEPGLYFMVFSALCKALEQATTFISNRLQIVGQPRPDYIPPHQPIMTTGSYIDIVPEPERHSAFKDECPPEPASDIKILLRRRGQARGGESDVLPSSMDKLLDLAHEYWRVNAVSVRDALTGVRIRRIGLITNGQVLELLTQQEEDEAQLAETQ